MNIVDIQTRVKRTVGDDSGILITDADILRWINDAQMDIVRNTECLTATTNVTVAAGTSTYALPTDFFRVQRVTYNGAKLIPLTQAEVDRHGGAMNQPGYTNNFISGAYYLTGNSFINVSGPEMSASYPLIVQYSKLPATLVVGVDTETSMPLQYHEDIVKYALARAYDRLNNTTDSTRAESQYRFGIGRELDEVNRNAESYPVIRSSYDDDY